MVYTKQLWNNGAAGSTPINALRLSYMEDGIERGAAHDNEYFVYVDNILGSNSNDGLSPGKAKGTIEQAHAVIPAGGGTIRLVTNQVGYYDIAAPVIFTKPIWVEGFGYGQPSIRRQFDGPLFTWYAVTGGGLRNLELFDDSTSHVRTGSAINIISTVDSIAGAIRYDNVRFTSSDSLGAWERIITIDGSANAAGVRQVNFTNCTFFGARTPADTIHIIDGVHIFFTACIHVPAPLSGLTLGTRQGMKLINSGVGCSDIHCAGFEMIGDLYSEAVNFSYSGGRIGSDVSGATAVELITTARDTLIACVIAGPIINASTDRTCTVIDATRIVGAQTIYANTTTDIAWAVRTSTDTTDRMRIRGDGVILFGDGAGVLGDAAIYRLAANSLRLEGTAYMDTIVSDEKVLAAQGIGVGNSAAATTPGTVTKKIQVFDAAGASIGYIPVYDAIT